MTENKPHRRREAAQRSYCQIGYLPAKSASSCSGPAQEDVDGLLLCERHALEAKLEGQIECWGGMLFHIELWSREARRQKRPEVVELLEDQRAQATSARHRAYEDLALARTTETLGEGKEPPPTRRHPLRLPPKAARQLSLRLRRLRRG
jgi:hypothetical protein